MADNCYKNHVKVRRIPTRKYEKQDKVEPSIDKLILVHSTITLNSTTIQVRKHTNNTK